MSRSSLRRAAIRRVKSLCASAERIRFYDHDRTSANTYINDKIVVCMLENILTTGEPTLIADGERGHVIEGRVAFQAHTEDEFTAATLFFLDTAPTLTPLGAIHDTTE